jgi:hypothetical protein
LVYLKQMIKKYSLLFIICCIKIGSFAQSLQKVPCSDTVYRQFDFWIGEWEAFDINGQKTGDSKIEIILDSCIILENWTSISVIKGIRYAGKSYNSYNAATKKWQQYWVDNVGGVTEYFDGIMKTTK